MIQPLTGIHARVIAEADHHRLNILEGAVRSGKTVTSLLKWLEFVRWGPPGNLLMVGKTERTLRRNVLSLLTAWLPRSEFRIVAGEGTAWIGGREVWLVGANNEASVAKIQGMSLVGAYGDEFSVWPQAVFKMLLSRLSEPGAKLIGTTNPDHPKHWLRVDVLDRADELDLGSWRLTIDDNPTLDPAYVRAIKAEYTGLWYQRYIEGRWVAGEGRIYDLFDPDDGRIVTTEAPGRWRRWWLAVDYGTSNPFVALLIGLGDDGRLHVAAEWRWDGRRERRQLTDAEYSARLAGWLTGEVPALVGEQVRLEAVVVDPSAASFVAQLRRDRFGTVVPADNAVADGIRAVSQLMAPAVDRLRIHPRCAGLVGELGGYVWDPTAAKVGEDRPVKVDDHGPDALRYGVMHVLAGRPPAAASSSWAA